MAEQSSLRRRSPATPTPQPATRGQAEAERSLARALSWLLPAGTIAIGVGVGIVFDVASAFLVLVTGALLGAILLLWFSLRTLAGDVPVDPSLDLEGAYGPGRTEQDDRKRRALRSLKDLEQEHAIGKIDDDDYAKLLAEYRTQAKAVIREMDDALVPYRDEAEALVRAHLKKRNITPSAEAPTPKKPAAETATAVATRVACPSCDTTNDSDASFCKKCGAKLGDNRSATADDEEDS